jgi:hypothetical protein
VKPTGYTLSYVRHFSNARYGKTSISYICLPRRFQVSHCAYQIGFGCWMEWDECAGRCAVGVGDPLMPTCDAFDEQLLLVCCQACWRLFIAQSPPSREWPPGVNRNQWRVGWPLSSQSIALEAAGL